MLINLLKSPIPQWWGKWKNDPESISGTESPPEALVICRPNHRNTKFQWNHLITFAVILHTEWQMKWPDHRTTATAEVIMLVVSGAKFPCQMSGFQSSTTWMLPVKLASVWLVNAGIVFNVSVCLCINKPKIDSGDTSCSVNHQVVVSILAGIYMYISSTESAKSH